MNIDQSPAATTRVAWLPTRRRIAIACCAAGLIMALASGCGGDGGDGDDGEGGAADSTSAVSGDAGDDTQAPAPVPSGDGSIDPCSLVTFDEAAAVLGAEPVEPINVSAGGVAACTYRLADASAGVQVNVERGDGGAFLSQAIAGDGDVIEGVGDAAKASPFLGQVTVVEGDVRFAVFVTLAGGTSTDLATLRRLAETAVGRL